MLRGESTLLPCSSLSVTSGKKDEIQQLPSGRAMAGVDSSERALESEVT
jgi:hypothetical protein